MKWSEFASLLGGINADTALGRLVQVRLENDKNMLKNFTAQQRKIRSDWHKRKAKEITNAEAANAIEQFRQMFVAMSCQ